MGIVNIHMFTEDRVSDLHRQAQAALEEKLMLEHRRGEHRYGSMRRECPLCQASR